MTGEFSVVVTPEMTAAHYGNTGVEVLATPYLMGLLESAAGKAIEPALEPGESSVGTHLDVRHLAATPLGMRVSGRARLIEANGRRLLFEVEAHDEVEAVARGTHERVVIELQRFLRRVEQKRPARGRGDV